MRAAGTLARLLLLLRGEADRRVRAHLAVALLLAGASGLLAALAPVALKTLVDGIAIGNADARASLVSGAAYILAFCGARLLVDIGPLLSGTADRRLERGLTRRFFDHVLELPMAYLLQRRSGELLRSLDLGSASSQVFVAHAANSLVPALVEAGVMAVVLHKLDQPGLVAVFAATACLYLIVFAEGARRVARRARQVSAARLEQNALLADSLMNCETLRCFAAEPAARDRVESATRVLETSWVGLHRLRTGIALVITAIFVASLTASLFLAGDALARGAITVGGFILANLYMVQLVRPLELLGNAVRDIAQAVGFAEPMLEILAEPREPKPEPCAAAQMRPVSATAPTIRFENVVFGYHPGRPVIRGLDLEIPAGRTVAVVGSSGSGKSSLTRLLLRLYQPQSGRILFDGVPIDTLPTGELRRRIGLVPQDTQLFHDTVARNIALGEPDAGLDEIARAAGRAQLHPFIATLPAGYATPVGERGLQLAGGERQRIAVARALLKQVDVYLFDEATSMLDSGTEAALMTELRMLTAGRTTLLIAHRLSTVVRADEIVVLHAGRIAERGSHAELLQRHGRYARMWHQQTRGPA